MYFPAAVQHLAFNQQLILFSSPLWEQTTLFIDWAAAAAFTTTARGVFAQVESVFGWKCIFSLTVPVWVRIESAYSSRLFISKVREEI